MVELRSAEAGDVDALARVHVATWRETYVDLLPERFFGEEALAHRQRLWRRALIEDPQASHSIVVAEDDEDVVGFAWAGPTMPDDADTGVARQLYAIYLLARDHGRGVGRRLLDAVIGDADACLWVARENPRARRFYERAGFVADGLEKPDDRVPTFWELRMVRRPGADYPSASA